LIVRLIFCRIDKRYGTNRQVLSQAIELIACRLEFCPVSTLEFIPFYLIVIKPLSQLSAWRSIFQPQVYVQ